MLPAADSLDEAHAAIELWEYYSGKALDPSQYLTVEVMMAQRADGTWAAATTGREMPRQNGKGDEVEVVELWGLVQRAEAILHTVHDAVLLSTQTQQRMLGVLEGHADLRRLVKRKWLGTGQQMIEMRNGGVIWYRTRTNGGGRGVDDVARLVIDEAQHATEEHIAAVSPTLLANENPQMNVLGTAGIDGKSAWWWSVRKRAVRPNPGAFGYVGHTAERLRLVDGRVAQEPVDAADRALWAAANPSVGVGRGGGMAFLEEQFQRLGARRFANEHLCVWDPEPDADGPAAIPMPAWKACEDERATFDDVAGPPVFAVDVTPDRSKASIAVAGRRSDGLPYGEIVENRAGTTWVKDRVAELKRTWRGRMVCDPAGPAGSLLADGVDLEPIGAREHAQACGLFYDMVVGGKMRHRPDRLLDVALSAAVKKDVGDGLWLWSRNKSTVDISPLVALTLALGAVAGDPPPPPVSFDWI